jgi:hypothetical protein
MFRAFGERIVKRRIKRGCGPVPVLRFPLAVFVARNSKSVKVLKVLPLCATRAVCDGTNGKKALKNKNYKIDF